MPVMQCPHLPGFPQGEGLVTIFPEHHSAIFQTLSCRPDILKVWDLEMRLAKAECPSEWHAHALQPASFLSVLTCIQADMEPEGRLQLLEQPASGSALVLALSLGLCCLGPSTQEHCAVGAVCRRGALHRRLYQERPAIPLQGLCFMEPTLLCPSRASTACGCAALPS